MASVFRPGALALISGGASGVGFAFAQHCRRQGMHVALLDINRATLTAASSALQAMDNKLLTLTYEIDVSDLDAWAAVRADVEGKFQTIDFLMLNAGMAIRTTTPWKDASYFHKTLATNYFGVVHGLVTFLPLVTKSSGPAAVVMTGSKQGITNPPGNPAYNASKSAVKTTAEQLAHDLRTSGSTIYAPHVSAHLLVPGWTFTGLSGNVGPVPDEAALKNKPRGAWLPSQVAEYGVQKIERGQFYIICPDADVDEALDNARMTWAVGDITEGRSALSRWDEKVKDEAAGWIQKEAERRRGN
ncbi:putative oxidoreductase,short chain dehydrogenase [Cladophialophora carrionii]|uniref:Putative oxidoreductase,short chain dehydrogenase n=1 Tax=Cladophialophora carrionii TaxID=86049 RepID=A0A1C1CF68_9EURO|nr:putative oxidoreductase,short chain dehydrogenase [Cladophialophora carrionii]